MKQLILLVALFMFTYGYCQTVGAFNTTIPHNGGTRTASLYVPLDYNSSHSYPLIIGMHGGGGTTADIRDMYLGFADSLDAILICPMDPSFGMNVILSAEDYVKSSYNIDTNQIFLSGYSLGGRSVLKFSLATQTKYRGFILIAPAIQSHTEIVNGYYNFANAENESYCHIVGRIDWPFVSYVKIVHDSLLNRNAFSDTIIKSGVDHFGSYFGSVDFDKDCLKCWEFITDHNPTPTSVDSQNDEKIRIFPNPSINTVSIEFIGFNEQSIELLILDLHGRVLHSERKKVSHVLSLDIGSFASGTYVLRVTDNKGVVANKKLVVL